MTDSEHPDLTPEEERARERLRALSPVGADPAFRAELREQFVSGRIDREAGEKAAAEPRPTAKSVDRGKPNLLRRRGRLLAVAVAAGLLALVIWRSDRPLHPELVDLTGTGTVAVNGEVFDLADRVSISRALKGGATLVLSDDATLDVRYGATFLLQYDPNTRATLPGPFGGKEGRDARARVDVGELRVLTGPDFVASTIRIDSPEGLIRVTGTMISIWCDDTGTCVCVHEGTASVGVDEEDMESVPAGRRKVMPKDKEPFLDDIAPPHFEHLLLFEEKYKNGF